MRRTILAASALSLGLLIQQGTGLGFGTALAQDRSDTSDKQAAQPAEKNVTPERASKAETDKAETGKPEAAKAEAKNKSEKAANNEKAEPPPSKQEVRPSKASEAARQGQLEERNEPATRSATELNPTLKPAATPTEQGAARPVTDPKLKPVPATLNGQLKPSREAAQDRELRERVQASLLKNESLPYTARLVSVTVKDGEITLRGQLNTQHEKVRVERAVEAVRGEHVVHNELRVRSPSSVARATPVE